MFTKSDKQRVKIVQEGGTSDRKYCALYKPDGNMIGGYRSSLERYARSQGWIPEFVPAPKTFRVEHGL